MPEAQALRRGGGREAALPLLGEIDRLFQPLPQLLVLRVQAGNLREQFGVRRAAALGLGDGRLDALGLLVGGLTTAAGLVGTARDVAAVAEQDGGGIADPGADR